MPQIKTLVSDSFGRPGQCLCHVNFGCGLHDEEDVGVREAGGEELLAGFVESVGDGGEDDAAIAAADKIEMALLLNEF